MATRYFPQGLVEVGGMPAQYGYPAEPPLAWMVTAEQLNRESGHSIEEGRFHPETGAIHGVAEFARTDTYIDGTAGRSGIAFDVIEGAGVWKDDYKDPIHNTYGLLLPDSAPGTVYEVVSTDAFSYGIPNCEILLRRGFPGVSSDDDDYKRAACYTYLTFGYGNVYQYRLAFRYGWPMALEFSKDSGSSWFLPQMARNIGSLESYLAAHNYQIRLKVGMDRTNEVLRVEIGNGNVLRWGLPRDLTGEMRRGGKVRLESENGWLTFNMWPARNKNIVASVRPRHQGRPITTLSDVRFAVNATGVTPENQTTNVTINPESDGSLSMQIEASNEDAGDGLGSEEPPVFSDVMAITPGRWTLDVDGLPDFRTASGFYKQRVEESFFNPVTRMFRQRARVCLSNGDGSLSDLVGDLACRVYASNGSGYYPRLTGIARNPALSRMDPYRLYWMDVRDKCELLEKDIGQEILLDRWCVFSAVRFVAEVCGVHPRFLWRIPFYPYGPAGYDCPYPILGAGVGNNPKHGYLPNVPGLAIILELVQDMNLKDPISGRVIPYYTGFDILGDMVFEPIDHFSVLPKWAFSDLDPSGQGQITGQIDWQFSTDNVRTDIIKQGMDPWTNDLLHTQRQVSVQARRMRGTRVVDFDRSARHFSLEQMEEASNVQAVNYSIPELTGAFRAPAQENLHAGDLVYVNDYFHGIADWFVIERMKTVSGCRDVTGLSEQAGKMDCFADYLVRARLNYF